MVIVVQAVSSGFEAGNMAEITINDKAVKMSPNKSYHFRGLHIVIINKRTGNVELARVFDTYKKGDSFDEFINREIPEGLIVVAACKDDMATNLSHEGRKWFGDMGSKEIWTLSYRRGFAFIGISGRTDCKEKRAHTKQEKVEVTQVFRVSAGGEKGADSKPEVKIRYSK